jgi:hypothetical protein
MLGCPTPKSGNLAHFLGRSTRNYQQFPAITGDYRRLPAIAGDTGNYRQLPDYHRVIAGNHISWPYNCMLGCLACMFCPLVPMVGCPAPMFGHVAPKLAICP